MQEQAAIQGQPGRKTEKQIKPAISNVKITRALAAMTIRYCRIKSTHANHIACSSLANQAQRQEAKYWLEQLQKSHYMATLDPHIHQSKIYNHAMKFIGKI
jgi:hypothetical protein